MDKVKVPKIPEALVMECKTVLVVDDAKFMRKKLSDILLSGGFNVIGEAEDGEQAVEMAKTLKPDIITMDITMPKMDGIESVKSVKAVCPDTLIIMISALGQKEKVKESIQAGASTFILKPFEAEKVLATVRSVATR